MSHMSTASKGGRTYGTGAAVTVTLVGELAFLPKLSVIT